MPPHKNNKTAIIKEREQNKKTTRKTEAHRSKRKQKNSNNKGKSEQSKKDKKPLSPAIYFHGRYCQAQYYSDDICN